jgi:hypothetical protein
MAARRVPLLASVMFFAGSQVVDQVK